MKRLLLSSLLLCLLPESTLAAVPADWTTPFAPFQISGNLYYVGSRDLAAYLLVTPKGNILINANLETSPPQIRHSVEQLGYKWADTKVLLSSQAHYDHAAGAAEVLRETHAKHMVMDGDVSVIQSGGATDYDHTMNHFPPARVDRTLHDGETVALGGTTVTAHKTAGHTRGCTTWTFQTHEGARTLNVVVIGGMSWNPAVQLVTANGKTESYPGIANDFEQTFKTLDALPVDIFLGAHGVYFNMLMKRQRMSQEGRSVWIDPAGYHKAVDEKAAAFHKEILLEQARP